MKIFHVVESLFKYGGSNVACVDFVTRQSERGNEVALFSTSFKEEMENLKIPPDVKLYLASRKKMFFRMSYVEDLDKLMSDAILSFKPDIVHVHGLWDPLVHKAIQNAYKKDIKIVHSPHGMLTPWALNNKKHKKKIAWNLYQHKDLCKVSAFHVTCNMEKNDLRRLGFKQDITVIPLGIDVPFVELRNKKPSRSILFMSRIHPVKGILNLVYAWDKIRKSNWKIIVCGPDDDNHLDTVKKEIYRLELDDYFVFKGPVESIEKENLLRSCDLFLLPTHSENFGIVVLEALSYGLPVITTVGAPWENITKYNAGWWIEIGVAPLIVALNDFFSLSEEARIEMGLNAISLADKEYSWKMVIDNLLDVYNNLIVR